MIKVYYYKITIIFIIKLTIQEKDNSEINNNLKQLINLVLIKLIIIM